MSFSDDLLSILGTDASSLGTTKVIALYNLHDVYDDPPFDTYVGSSERGVDILIRRGKVMDIQIFVQGSVEHSPFGDELPFGLAKGMAFHDVHALLGAPNVRDAVGSRYSVLNSAAKLTIGYDELEVVKYISVSIPM